MELIAVCDSKTNTAPDFPIGWWSVARSHELEPGDVKAVSALDRELVVYRTESGEARVHDAFCPHLGAHLGVNGKWLVSLSSVLSTAGNSVATVSATTSLTATRFQPVPRCKTGLPAK